MRRRRTRRTNISGRIRISGPDTSIWKRGRARRPYLRDIHVHNPAGFVSFGWPEGDVPSMRRGVPAIVARISRDLFLADLDVHRRRLTADVAPEFGEELYRGAVWRASG